MKNFLKYAVSCLALGALLAGCSDWVESERVITQHPDEQSPILRDNAYYAALRDWKRSTKHKIAFGWYGSWTAVGASYQSRLRSAPDSMDIISIWSQWHSLTPEQMADKEFVQKIKGTKVTFTIFAHEVPDEFLVDGEVTPEGLATYARAYARDSMNKYSYDGIDLDYEPGFGGTGPLVGHDNENMKIFCQELSKYVGPKSGTGRLFMIDGVPYAVHKEIAELFDYGIVQAYNSSGYTDLQNRFDNAYAKGWKPEQYIFAENFESFWKNGGVTHTCRDGQVVNSLLGMARFNPEQGYCGGFGAYHMEYEYGNSAMPYKYMREAIQDVNPAGGSIVASFTKNDMPEYSFLIESDGSISGSMDEKVQLTLSQKAPADLTVSLAMDNSLVETYNLKNGKSYLTARHARNQGRGIPVRRSSGRVRRRRRREGRVPASHRGGTPRRGRIRLEERPDGALHRHPGLDHGHRHRSHGAHGHEDRTRGRLDHLLLSGNQLVGRHRRLELRHRRTESQNVRRQTRRTVLVRKQPILLVGLRRQLHHRTGQDVRRERLPLALLLRGLQPADHGRPVQRRRKELDQPEQSGGVRSQSHRPMEDLPVQGGRESPLHPGVRGERLRFHEHERGGNPHARKLTT